MSTRGCVAVGVPRKWEGIYNHCDSYPSGLGKDLWEILRHQKDLKGFAERLLKCGSWPGFLAGELENDYDHRRDCSHITSDNPDPLYIEWVYIIDTERNMIHVMWNREVGNDDWSRPRLDPPVKRPDGAVDYGRFAYKHVLAASIELGGPEPDWAAIMREKHPDEED